MPLKPPSSPADHPAVSYGKIGVVLINLGTPDAPEPGPVRRYLRQFLSDGRVIELNKFLWWPILNGPILAFRPRKTARNYAKIWDGESPLLAGTRDIASAVDRRLGDDVVVRFAMRYGQPSVASVMDDLTEQGCDRILCFALYPQYSATTTASHYDAAFRWALTPRWQPALRTVGPYHDHPAYIAGLKESLDRAIEAAGFKPDVILASFHGLPKENLGKGDPYHCQCQKTGRLLREAMGVSEDVLRVTFQSRFGPKEWLQPYTDDVAAEVGAEGKSVMVISPGFVADCLETLEELAMGTREIFEAAGGGAFHYVPCLNDGDDAIALYEDIIRTNLAGWVPES